MSSSDDRSGFKEIFVVLDEMRNRLNELKLSQELTKQAHTEFKSQIAEISTDLERKKIIQANANSEILREIREIRALIDGAGNEPGMKGRIQRLEDSEEGRKFHLRALWVATIGAIASWFRS